MCLTTSAGACSSPTSPTPPAAVTAPTAIPGAPVPPGLTYATVSGTVWVHAADGIKPYSNGRLFGWIQTERVGWTTGAVGIDGTGRYRFTAPLGSFIRIQVAGDYQPCAVKADVRGDLSRDVRVVSDPRQLGARLPPELLVDTPTLSGAVSELTAEGRRPLSDVRVELDGLGGLGLVTATTLTDAAGRYVLCGLGGDSSTYLFASKAGYKLFEQNVPLSGSTTLDIELQH